MTISKLIVSLDLSDDQLRAIGHVTAQWAIFETHLDMVLRSLVEKIPESARPPSLKMPFNKRISLWRKFLDGAKGPKEKIKAMQSIVDRAAILKPERDAIVHGWMGTTDDGSLSITTFKQKKELDISFLNRPTKEIEALANKIATLTGDIVLNVAPQMVGGRYYKIQSIGRL